MIFSGENQYILVLSVNFFHNSQKIENFSKIINKTIFLFFVTKFNLCNYSLSV